MKYLMIALTLFITACNQSSDQVVTEFLNDLRAANYPESASKLSDKYRDVINQWHGGLNNDNLKSFYKSGVFEEFDISQINESDKFSKYKVVIKTSSGGIHTSYIKLVKQDSDWKISSF